MKAIAFISSVVVFMGISIAQADVSAPISPDSLQGKQIKVLNPDMANKLFERMHTVASSNPLVLANGQVQEQSAAQASGAVVICRFSPVPVYQNGYFPFSTDSKLGVVKIDSSTVVSLNLIQINFTVRHNNNYVGMEHLNRQFNCSNQVGTIFSTEALDEAFGNVLAFE